MADPMGDMLDELVVKVRDVLRVIEMDRERDWELDEHDEHIIASTAMAAFGWLIAASDNIGKGPEVLELLGELTNANQLGFTGN